MVIARETGILQHHVQYLPVSQRLPPAAAYRPHVPAFPGVPQHADSSAPPRRGVWSSPIAPAEVFAAGPLGRLPSLENERVFLTADWISSPQGPPMRRFGVSFHDD